MCYSALVKRQLGHLSKRYGAIAIREQIDDYDAAHGSDPKKFPKLDDRIYPGNYAPIIHMNSHGERVIELMRYGAYPPASVKNPKAYTTFNARRDNLLSPFWSEAFCKHHGFVVLGGFYEWVAVRDLMSAGVVTLNDVETEFERQKEARKAKFIAAGKKYKSTPNEQKDARMRQIIIEFKPEDEIEMIAPVIFSYSHASDGPGGRLDMGFAIVTDDPPLEISNAGHDRCPVILTDDALDVWLRPDKHSAKSLIELLGVKKRLTFKHRLAETA